jgi:hypothetical protein
MKMISLNKLFIFSIIIDDKFEYEIIEIGEVKYIKVGLTFFLKNFLENSENTKF